MSSQIVTLRDPLGEGDSACLGGVFSDCGISPVTGVGIYSGSVENQVFFVHQANCDWTNINFSNRCSVSIDGSIIASAISVDGSVTACALAPSEEGAELHVIKTPPPGMVDSVKSIKIFDSPLFAIRSVSFAMNGRLKTKLFVGTDEGKIFSVSLKAGGNPTEIKPTSSSHGGVKCVRSCPLTGNVAVSFCDGFVILFDSASGSELESKKIAKKTMTPDSVEKFFVDWHPKPKERLLAVAGRVAPIVLKSGHWATTPLNDDVAESSSSIDGVLSVVKWSWDGAFIAAVTSAGSIHIYEFSSVTGPVLKIRAASASNTIVSLAWGFDGNSHVVNALGLKGVRTALSNEEVPLLKRELKIDIASLLSSSKEAAAGNIESGLVEEEGLSPSAENVESEEESESESSGAESVDESPEQLQEELEDLLETAKNGRPSPSLLEKTNVDKNDFENEGMKSRKTATNIGIDRQFSFQPGATVGARKSSKGGVSRKLLCWNQFGSVVRTDFPGEENNNTTEDGLIEVSLDMDSAPMKQFRLKDNLHGWALASLGSRGLALAVKSKFDLTDRYEDDMLDEDEQAEKKKKDAIDELTGGLSKVCYRPFTSWGNQREWIIALPIKAEVESVAAGSCCVAAIASDSTVRVWSAEGGFMLWSWSLKSEVPVSIAANGELFCITSVMRSRSTESLQYETFLTQNGGGNLVMLSSGPLPISATPGTALCWLGISEDFVPFTCDTQGVMRGLYPFNSSDEESRFAWVPLLNFVTDHQKRGEGYWPVFVSERDVWCVPTRAEEDYEPRVAPLPPIMSVGLRPQTMYVADRSDSISPESQLFVDRIIAAQARLCAKLGLPASVFKTAVDGDLEKAIKKVENSHDKRLAEIFRKLLETGKLEKALGGAALAVQSMTSRLMVRMAAALGLRTLEARLEDLFNPKASAAGSGEISAAATLFPHAGKAGGSAPRVDSSSNGVAKPAVVVVQEEKISKGGAVLKNPFAKKRSPDDENDENSNKVPRNA